MREMFQTTTGRMGCIWAFWRVDQDWAMGMMFKKAENKHGAGSEHVRRACEAVLREGAFGAREHVPKVDHFVRRRACFLRHRKISRSGTR